MGFCSGGFCSGELCPGDYVLDSFFINMAVNMTRVVIKGLNNTV